MEVTSGQVCDDLIALLGRTKAGIIDLAGELQLTPIQVFALYAILKGDATMGRVACALHCDPSNVTGIVDRLVSQGLVVRAEDAHDRRARTLQLTAKGQETIDRLMEKLPAYLGCNKLSAHELTALHGTIGKLTT